MLNSKAYKSKKHLSPSKLHLVSTEPWLVHIHDYISDRGDYQYKYTVRNWQGQTVIVNDEPPANNVGEFKMSVFFVVLPWYFQQDSLYCPWSLAILSPKISTLSVSITQSHALGLQQALFCSAWLKTQAHILKHACTRSHTLSPKCTRTNTHAQL